MDKTDKRNRPLFQSADCVIYLDHDVPCLLVEWRGYLTSARFREICNRIPGLLRTHRLSKMLADDRLLESILAAEQEWIANDWLPQAIEAGYRSAAVVRAYSHFTRVTTEQNGTRIAGQVDIRFFDNEETAKDWLKQTG